MVCFPGDGLVMLFLLRKNNKRLLIIMTAILVFCWILINPVLTILGVSETNLVEAFAVSMQQVARVITEGRELTADELSLLGEIFWMDKVPALYNPLTVDPIKFETFRYVEKPAILQPLTSIGLHVWALVSSTLINVLKRKEEFLLSIPVLVLIAGLWIGTPVYSEFRYAYPMFLSMPLILAVTLFTVKDTEKTMNKKCLWKMRISILRKIRYTIPA